MIIFQSYQDSPSPDSLLPTKQHAAGLHACACLTFSRLMHARIANNVDEPSQETACKTAAEAVISFCVDERRPECRDSSWVDAEQRSFNWPFFSAFIEELDRLQNVEMVARQRDSCVRLAGPKTPSGLCKASPLQIVNQLVAQKRLVMSSADGATSAVKKLRVSALMAHCSLLSDTPCLGC